MGSPPPQDILDTTAAGPAAIRGSALRGLGYGAGVLLTLASIPFMYRHLGVVDFGRYVLVLSLITLVAGITEGGLAAVGLREYTVRAAAERDALMRNLIGVRVALTVAGLAVAVAFTLVAGYDRTLVLGTFIVGLGLIAQSLALLLAIPLAAELRYGWTTAIDLVRQGLGVALTLALVVAGAELLGFFVVAVPAAVAGLALTAVLVRRTVPFRPRFDRAEWGLLVRDSLPYAAALAVNIAYFRIAIVIMSLITTELETGYFAGSFRILEALLPIPALAVSAAFPILARAARDDRARLQYAAQRILDVALIGGVGMVLVVEAAAPLMIEVLAGDAGEPSVDVLRLQAPALLATFVAVGCGFALLSLRRHKAILAANLAALVVSVALTFALVPPLGAQGAALATTAAEYALAMAVVVLLARSATGLRLSWGTVPRVAVAAGAGAAVLLIGALPVLVQTLLAGAVYVAALAVLKAIPAELTEALRPHRARRSS